MDQAGAWTGLQFQGHGDMQWFDSTSAAQLMLYASLCADPWPRSNSQNIPPGKQDFQSMKVLTCQAVEDFGRRNLALQRRGSVCPRSARDDNMRACRASSPMLGVSSGGFGHGLLLDSQIQLTLHPSRNPPSNALLGSRICFCSRPTVLHIRRSANPWASPRVCGSYAMRLASS